MPMTVAQVIAELSKFGPDDEVRVYCCSNGYHCIEKIDGDITDPPVHILPFLTLD